MMTPAQRTVRARAAAFSQHAQGRTNTRPAFAARLAALEAQVDPDARLAADERARRVAFAMKAQMGFLSLKASRARSRSRVEHPPNPNEGPAKAA